MMLASTTCIYCLQVICWIPTCASADMCCSPPCILVRSVFALGGGRSGSFLYCQWAIYVSSQRSSSVHVVFTLLFSLLVRCRQQYGTYSLACMLKFPLSYAYDGGSKGCGWCMCMCKKNKLGMQGKANACNEWDELSWGDCSAHMY
jgi:hypothetical protein